jgi:hypothetical protein
MLARMQRVEIGDAVNAEHHGLTVNDELLVPVLQCRLDDPRISTASVIAALGDQAHAVVVALKRSADSHHI